MNNVACTFSKKIYLYLQKKKTKRNKKDLLGKWQNCFREFFT